MAQFTRNLTFRANDLGKDSTLILTFDDEKSAFQSQFGKTGPYVFNVSYKSEFGFSRSRIPGDGTIESASTYARIKIGEKTILTKEGNLGVYSFSKPVTIDPPTTQMVAQNETDRIQDIVLGFFDRPDREPTQTFHFGGVGPGSSVQFEFAPILRGYITSDHKETAVLKGKILTKTLFHEDLVQLPENTHWKIEYNRGSGLYTITRDED